MHTILYPVNELKIGGAEQQLLELVRGLDKDRFRPIVAPLYPGGALDGEFCALPGVEVMDLNRQGKYDVSPLWRIGALLEARDVDIVQPFLSPSTFFGLLPALLVGSPAKIVTERCGVRLVRHLGYKLYRTVEDWLSRFADAVVANSVAGQELLIGRGIAPEKIRVIYNGLNRERLDVDPAQVSAHRRRLAVPEGGHVIGILASLSRPKGHEVLLRAAALLKENWPATRYAIVGDGPLRSELEALAGQLGLTDRVVFFGNQRRVGDHLAACDFLVSSSCDNEGCSNSILEALAVGLPVIATDVGGNRELIEPSTTGYLVPAGDAGALAARIEFLMANPAQADRVARLGNRMVSERFGLSRMVAEYEELYGVLLANRRAGEGRTDRPLAGSLPKRDSL